MDSYIPILKSCVATHPILSAAIRNEGSQNPEFVRPDHLDLRKHIAIAQPGPVDSGDENEDYELALLKRVTLTTHDEMFRDVGTVPPWRVVILPVPASSSDHSKGQRVYVLFAYSHSHGDGRSGLNFHKTFLEGLDSEHDHDHDPIYKTTNLPPLPPPFEEVCNLRISWSFLLAVLTGPYLPDRLRDWLGLRGLLAHPMPGTWLGTPMRYEENDFRTASEMLILPKKTVEGVIVACRAHGAKFTGLLNHVIVNVLSRVLPFSGSFIGNIVVDLRHLVKGYTEDDMVNSVSSVVEVSARVDSSYDDDGAHIKQQEAMWTAARKTATRLAARANTTSDQSIGLIKYVSNIRDWYTGQLGKDRSSSYEISNLVSFDPRRGSTVSQQKTTWDIEQVFFSQPANVTGCPLNFQVVSRKGGGMVITINWQVGVLGVDDEDIFVKDVAREIEQLLVDIASDSSN